MTIEQSLIIALRSRIVPSIIAAKDYQRIGDVPPETASIYIRESLTPLVAVENLQHSITYRYLAQFDIYLRRGADVNITSELFRLANEIREEFSTRSDKINITLSNWSGVSAFVENMPESTAMRQEDEFFYFPMQIYVSIVVDDAAQYSEPTPNPPAEPDENEAQPEQTESESDDE